MAIVITPPSIGMNPLSSGEFGLIAQHFQRNGRLRSGLAALGVGDDCALLHQPTGTEAMQWAISTDMLVSGQHFFDDVDATALGHKALAVNLSDLAACGAQPVGFTLALGLPQRDDAWLAAFAHGLFALADAHQCDLLGGDTTRSPLLTVSITVLGLVPAGQALLRSGARAGDDVWVSHPVGGGLGDARLALHALLHQRGLAVPATVHALPDSAGGILWNYLSNKHIDEILKQCRHRLEWPVPRVALGLALRTVATSCLDLSDGLAGDIQHILRASGVGCTLWHHGCAAQAADIADAAPNGIGLLAATSARLRACGESDAVSYALAGGDDYELLFTAHPAMRDRVCAIARNIDIGISRIGCIDRNAGLRWLAADGRLHVWQGGAFDHFADSSA